MNREEALDVVAMVPASESVRFWAKVEKTDSCWNWTAYCNNTGYGVILVERKTVLAHRWSYVYAHQSIPDGMILDHLCRNRKCVNPDHLEPVTQRENILRGVGMGAINARKTHCVHGHEFNEENTYIRPRGVGRGCLTCIRISNRKHYRKVASE